MDSVTPDAINKFCADKAIFESLLFLVVGIFVLIIAVEFVVIVTVCRRRKKTKRQYSRSKNESEQTFPYFVTAYVYQMKKEGHLKGHVQQFSTAEAKRALTDKQCINQIDQIKTHVTKYFVVPIDEYLIESPYYGFNTKSKHFPVEEKKHRQAESADVPDLSEAGSGRYETLNIKKSAVVKNNKAIDTKIASPNKRSARISEGSRFSSVGKSPFDDDRTGRKG